ncbi:MAG TPA: aromatic compound catabolic protein, partial [Desulfobacteraceae bacterium]|nr:aromatic compound catabolic protein [Desulfobacteraceae bacterium]
AKANLIHAGKQVATAEGRIYDANGKLYAHATSTCLIIQI